MANLFESVQLGSFVLANRVFMAPLTRTRADADGVPGELAATYYAQRASAGLIVTEATQISPMGKGYINTPGIHSPQQVRAWSRIVESVHKSGGRIFLQLWHVGRISHRSLLPNDAQPVAPSAIRANSQIVQRLMPLGCPGTGGMVSVVGSHPTCTSWVRTIRSCSGFCATPNRTSPRSAT